MKKKNLAPLLWIVVGLLLLGLLAARIFQPDLTWLTITLCTLLTVVLGILVQQNLNTLKGRTAAFGLQSLVTVFLVLGLLGVANFLFYRYPRKIDLTKNKIHSLSDQSIKIIKGLQNNLSATLYTSFAEKEKLRPLLENYKDLSPKFQLEFVDPTKEPTRAKQAGVRKYNTLILSYAGKTSKLEDVSEEKLTNALIKLLKPKKQTLCAITGHSEKSFSSNEPEGYAEIKKGLEDQSYEVKDLALPQEAKVPADCDALAIIGPTKAYFKPEIATLRDYLAQGGRAIIALDVVLKGADPETDLYSILSDWYVDTKNALIVDPLSKMLGVDAAVPILATYSHEHLITKEFRESSYFAFARPLDIKPGAPAGLSVQWLAKTTPKSWGETDFASLGRGAVQYNAGKDLLGPMIAAIAVEGKQKDSKAPRNTRIVAFGSSQFATNNFFRFGGNLDFFLNSASWVLEDESLISIRTKEDTSGKVELTQTSGQIIFWLTVILLPLSFAITGILVWLWRRRL